MIMKRGQKEGPDDTKRLMNCRTKDDVDLSVTYDYRTLIINNKPFKIYTDPESTRSLGWRDKLRRQIEKSISHVLKYYLYSMINNHKDHISRQVKNCLNENYLDEKEPLSSKGLAIKTVALTKINEQTKLY